MSTPALADRAKNAGVDLVFAKNLQKLEELKTLVDKGMVKPEVYQKLEDEIFRAKERVERSNQSSKPRGKQNKGLRLFTKKTPTDKLKDDGSPMKKSRTGSRSRGGSFRSLRTRSRADSSKSVSSNASGIMKKNMKGAPPVLHTPLLKFVKSRNKKKWARVDTILYRDRVEFKNPKDDKLIKTIKFTEDFFVSTVDERGAKVVIQRAADETDSLNSDEEENMERMNDVIQKMEEVTSMRNVFVIASLGSKRKTKILLACEDEMQRNVWVAMTCEVLRDLRNMSDFGDEDRKFSKNGWANIQGQVEIFRQKKVGQLLERDVNDLDPENITEEVEKFGQKGKKLKEKQFMQEWQSREAMRMKEHNRRLQAELKDTKSEFNQYKEKQQEQMQKLKEENEEKLKEEQNKNEKLQQDYDTLMEKYRAEALQRNTERKSDEERIKKRIKALQRRSIIPHGEEAAHYKKELEAYKAKLATLQKALNIDLDEMDWDGSLEQAEERMQECLKGILEGETPAIKAKAQQDFDKWDQLVRGHEDYRNREEKKWTSWEEENGPKNQEALEEMREKFVPEIFRKGCSVQTLMDLKGLKKKTAERIFKNKIFKFLWMPKEEIAKLHAASLNNDYASQGLDMRELRAVYASLPAEFMNDHDGKKKTFKETMRSRLHTLTEKQKNGKLSPTEEMHNDYRDKPVSAHPKPTLPKLERQKPKMNSKMKGNAAALEAFFKSQGGGSSSKPKPKKAVGGATAASASAKSELDPNDAKWKKYFVMKRNNLPEGAIRQKMVQDGHDPGVWDKLVAIKEGGGKKEAPKEAVLDPNSPEFKRYFTMQKAGLVDGAIKNKMVKDGLDPGLWDKLLELKANGGNESKPASVSTPTKPVKLDPNDKQWAEYFKMRKLKMSEGQIMNKMQKDGRDPSVWAKLVAMKDKELTEKNGGAPAPVISREDFTPVTESKKQDIKLKTADTEVSGGTGDIEDDLKRAKEKRRNKERRDKYDEDGNLVKRKKKKKKSRMGDDLQGTVDAVDDETRDLKKSLRRKSKKKRNSSKTELKKGGINDLLGRVDLDLDSVDVGKRGTIGVEIGTYGGERRRSVKGGRRKTLRKSKVGGLEGDSKIQQVIDYILTDGIEDPDEGGARSMKFGQVYENFFEISDVLVGVLLKAKKARQIKYKGDMLFPGIHDEVKITVL